MNLRHIWGDATCGNDLVADTPTHNTANYGAPAYPHYSTCSGNPSEMTMNYMDYVDDRAMYMFSTTKKIECWQFSNLVDQDILLHNKFLNKLKYKLHSS